MTQQIKALTPRGAGHQFVCYADCCSGIPDAPHAEAFAAINHVVQRLRPQPAFICFPGDEIRGLVSNEAQLRAQWQHWFVQEMGWLDRHATPLYHTTGNHTVYDTMSEAVYRDVMQHLPQNGPVGQENLSYYVRHKDLLLVFVDTMNQAQGGEGRVETAWLAQVLAQHDDATYKFVFGHHPVFSVNGFAGAFQRDVGENGRSFWNLLARHRVIAYFCSHILAFDVQVHDGVLQILTAGAGTLHRMPEGIEYLHCVQAAVDQSGLRYQVLDDKGSVREWLSWPIPLPPSSEWSLCDDEFMIPNANSDAPTSVQFVVWRITGQCAEKEQSAAQTLLCGWEDDALAPIWIGLRGAEQRVVVSLSPKRGRSPHYWLGPTLTSGQPFDIQIAIHTGMGPGGLLWRQNDTAAWHSLRGASAWGAERLRWPTNWHVGHGQNGKQSAPFQGSSLTITAHVQEMQFNVENDMI